MTATAFASSRPLDDEELQSAPISLPAPVAADRPAEARWPEGRARGRGPRAAHGRRPARPPAARPAGGARRGASSWPGRAPPSSSQVRSISSRPVRRRGMRPLVEATVADDTGVMKATFFNQPWLVQKYPAGTRLVLHGKFEARNRFRVQGHARTSEAATGADAVAHYPATEGLSSTQILALVRTHAGAVEGRGRAAPGAAASARAASGPARRRSAPRTSRAISTIRSWGAGGSRSTSCCSSSSRCFAGGGCAAARPSRRSSTASAS